MEYQLQTLSNGIRAVHLQTKSKVAHCCVMVNAGTRDELKDEYGLAHFIEHVIFKGTRRRKAFHVMSRLEDVGGELNAYTTKEETVVHATFLKRDFSRAVELIADILYQSTFPSRELEREKAVILDEINSYKDSPSELIFDEFEELIYPNHPFGRNILGSKRCLTHFGKNDILRFMERTYNTDQMVFCSVGDIPMKRVMRCLEECFGHIESNNRPYRRTPISDYVALSAEKKKNTFQEHCIVGCATYNLTHPKRIGLHLLNNILGGPGLNSRLNMSLRERKGYAYNVESSYTPFSDTGLFSIYFGSDRANFDKSLSLLHRELNLLRTKQLGILQLSKAKRQLIGQLAIAMENNEALMLNLARSILIYNAFDTFDAISSRIESISSSELLEIANEVFAIDNLSTLIYK